MIAVGGCTPAPGERSVSEKLAPVVRSDGTILVQRAYLMEVSAEMNFRPTSIWPADYVVRFIGYRCVKGAAAALAEVQYQNKSYFVHASSVAGAVNSPQPKC